MIVINKKPICRYCGSPNVTADGPCSYDPDKSEWKLIGDTYDDGICQSCGEENKRFEWINI